MENQFVFPTGAFGVGGGCSAAWFATYGILPGLPREGWAGRPETFGNFTAWVRERGAVTTTAAGRGRGLVGLL